MTFDFSLDGKVVVTQEGYVTELVTSEDIKSAVKTPAVVIRFCLTILSANVTFISVLFARDINLTCTCVRRAQIFSPLMMKTCCDDLLHNSKRFVRSRR